MENKMEKNKKIKDMVTSILDKDRDSFKSNFEAEINDRISSKLADMHHSISKDILKTTKTETEG